MVVRGDTGSDQPVWSERRSQTPVWVLDAERRFIHVNEAAERLFDQPSSELEGTSFWTQVPDDAEDRYREALARVYEDGEAAEFTLNCPLVDRWFRIESYPFEGRVSIRAHDVTEDVRRRQELALRERALREAYEVTGDREASTREKIQRLLSVIRSTLGTEFATLSCVRPGEETYTFEAVDAHEDESLPEGETIDLAELPNCAEVVRSRQSLVLHDIDDQAPDFVDPAWDISAYIGTPVWVDGDVRGTFCFFSTERRSERFNDWEVTYVELFADWVGNELERDRA